MKKQREASNNRRILMIAAAGLGIIALTVIGLTVGKPLIDMLADPAAFQAWVRQLGPLGRIAFVGIMALQVIIAWLPGEPLEIGAGYAFGFWEGGLLCMAGILVGSIVVFGLVRLFGRRLVTLFFPAEKLDSLPLLRDARRLTLVSFILFMIPGTPKDIMTYCVGLTSMRLTTWLLIAGVARIPPVITSTLSGSALGEAQYGLAIAVFAGTILLSIIGFIVYKKLGTQTDGGVPS